VAQLHERYNDDDDEEEEEEALLRIVQTEFIRYLKTGQRLSRSSPRLEG